MLPMAAGAVAEEAHATSILTRMNRRRHLLQRLLAPAARLVVRMTSVSDVWERFDLAIEPARFGSGASGGFQRYLRGPSRVRTTSLADIRDWLLACEYESDESLFASADFWQHPEQFERLRRGDCEDHALWVWRKLSELGIAAEFVVGRHANTPVTSGGHAWVTYTDSSGTPHLIESVAKEAAKMFRPLAEAREEYVPHFAVTHTLRTVAFGGYLYDLKQRVVPGDAAVCGDGTA